jgi:drug/metabolite transporter (DMT)-like permease
LARLRIPDAAGIGYTVLTAAAYAGLDVTARLAYRGELNVATLLTVRFLGAGLLLLAIGKVLGLAPRPPRRQVLVLLGLGAAGYAMESFLLNSALHAMPVGPVILLFYLNPSIIAVAALVMGSDRMTPLKLTALALSIVGVSVLLAFPTRGMNLRGTMLALGAAIAFSAYALVSEHVIRGVHALLFSGFVMLGAGMSIAAFGVPLGAVHVALDTASWGWVLLHLLLISVAILSLTGAITRLGATRASIGNTLELAMAVVLSALILGERLGPLQIAGGVLLVVALAVLPFAGKPRTPAAEIPLAE